MRSIASVEGSTTSSRAHLAVPGADSTAWLHQRPPPPSRAFSNPDIRSQPAFLHNPISERIRTAANSIRSAPTYRPRPYFRSRRIQKGTIDRPELREYDPREKYLTIIPLLGILLGLAFIAILAWNGWASVTTHVYCPVFTDDFSNGFNSTIWTKDVETGGYKYVAIPHIPSICITLLISLQQRRIRNDDRRG